MLEPFFAQLVELYTDSAVGVAIYIYYNIAKEAVAQTFNSSFSHVGLACKVAV